MAEVVKEIQLTDLLQTLATNKKTIFFAALTFLVVGIVGVSMIQPVYKAESFFLPPAEKDVQVLSTVRLLKTQLIQGNSEDGVASNARVDTDRVFELFIRNLTSRKLRWEFFIENHLAERLRGDDDATNERVYESEFFNKLKLRIDKKSKFSVSLSYESFSSEDAADLLNRFVEMIKDHTAQEFIENEYQHLASLQTYIDEVIAGKLNVAKHRREDQIVRLMEALEVANALGLKDAAIAQQVGDIESDSVPLYLRGSRALDAEIKVLKSRKDDIAFVEGLRDLQETSASIKEVRLDPSVLRVAIIDRPALAPHSPIRPNKPAVLTVMMVLGLIVGALIALAFNPGQPIRAKSAGIHPSS